MPKPLLLPVNLLLFRLKSVFTIVITVFTIATNAHSQDIWTQKADFGGEARVGAVGFSVGSKGYIGLGSGSKQYHDLWEYDPATNTWTQKADYPGGGSERAVGFGISDKGYVGTGDTSAYAGRVFFSDFYQYDPANNAWIKKADYPGGGTSYAVGFSVGSKGYIGTGWNGSVKKDFYEYDPTTDKWIQKADFGGAARMSAVGFSIGVIGYIGTGNTMDQAQNSPVSDFWAYDPSTNLWLQKEDYGMLQFGGQTGNFYSSLPVYDAVGFSINNRGYIGTGTSDGSSSAFSEYDPSVDQWTRRADFGSIPGIPTPQGTGHKIINNAEPFGGQVVGPDGNAGNPRDNAAAFSIGANGYIGTGHFGAAFNDFYEYTACGDKDFTAQFDVVQDNFKLSFSAQKVANVQYYWDFGDGTYDAASDTLSSVFHIYNNAGTYQVTLSAYKSCYRDVLSKTVTVTGIKGVVNNHGGNTGIVTASIIGSGFTSIYLSKGGQQIQGTNLTIQGDGSATAMFNLTGATVGFWDVVAVFPGNQLVTIPNGYFVEDGNTPKLSIDLTGDWVVREGFNQHYTLNYHNAGNTDARLVPVFIGGLPLGTDIEIREQAFDISTLPGADTLKDELSKIPHTINDSVSQTSFRLILLNKIPANSSGSLTLVFHVPLTVATEQLRDIIYTIGYSYDASETGSTLPLKINAITPNGFKALDATDAATGVEKCADAIVKEGVQKVLEKKLEAEHDILGYRSCYTGATHLLSESLMEKDKDENFIDQTSKVYDEVTTGMSCTRAFLNTVAGISIAFGQFEIAAPAMEVSVDIFADQESLERIGPLIAGAALFNDCSKGPQDKHYKRVIIGNATDPNQIYGSGDASSNHYSNQGAVLNYVVNFENKPESNLNAQTVTVIDTLKSSYYNLKTFGFTSVTIGDSVFRFKTPLQSFIHDFDFTGLYNVKARVVASFDTISGVARWQFLTIDPITNQVTTNALSGFLPPDKQYPEGQGFVSYQIAPKSGIATGDQIQNVAYITFDYNPVIATNVWKNTFDFIAPASNVQPLPAITRDSIIAVQWGGKDNLSGVQQYSVFFAKGNDPYQLWLSSTTLTTANFVGKPDSTYRFYSIAYDNAGNMEAVKFAAEATTTIKIPKSQTINFPQINAKTYGDTDFDPGAITSSALPVTYISSNPALATVVNGKIHIISVGTLQITASQPGNDSTAVAVSVTNQLVVAPAPLNLKAVDQSKTYGADNPPLVINYKGFVNGDDSTKLVTPPIITTTATNSSPTGTYPITASGAVSTNYTFNYLPGTLTITQASQTITFTTLPAKIAGDPDFTLSANSSSGLPVSFQSGDNSIATIVNGNQVHLLKAGNITITASQPGDNNYNSAADVSQTLNIIPVPVIAANGPTIFNSGGSVVLTASTGAGYTYIWTKDGTDITGATTSSYTATEGGSYTVSIVSGSEKATSAAITLTSIFTLPQANFKLTINSATCKGSNNGSVTINATQSLSYGATITGNGLNTAYPFTSSQTINNLSPGTYSVCITVEGQPDYRQCYDVVITEPKDLSLYTTINGSTNSVNLALIGGTQYNISLNGVSYTTTDNSITLPLKTGDNDLLITTDKICQGTIEKHINFSTKIVPYPDPFQTNLSLNLGNTVMSNVTVEVYNLSYSKLYYSKQFGRLSGILQLDLSSLQNGVYALKLTSDNSENIFKILKQ